jgi:crossover junction endodeoxyribonuclease RuvC
MRRGMIVVGIDPGLRGGVCVLGPDPLAVPMPVTGGQIDGRELAVLLSGASMVAIEHAQAMPRQGVASTFRYGTGFGILLGVCEALGLPYRLVRPRIWQAAIIGTGAGDTKQRSIGYVHRLHPWVDLTPGKTRLAHDGIADAVCIAEWGQKNAP